MPALGKGHFLDAAVGHSTAAADPGARDLDAFSDLVESHIACSAHEPEDGRADGGESKERAPRFRTVERDECCERIEIRVGRAVDLDTA